MAEDLAKEGHVRILLTDPRVQVFLVKFAFPGDSTAMMEWAKGEERLSSRFRAFIDDPNHVPAGNDIDITDPDALHALLEGVRAHEPEETVH